MRAHRPQVQSRMINEVDSTDSVSEMSSLEAHQASRPNLYAANVSAGMEVSATIPKELCAQVQTLALSSEG